MLQLLVVAYVGCVLFCTASGMFIGARWMQDILHLSRRKLPWWFIAIPCVLALASMGMAHYAFYALMN